MPYQCSQLFINILVEQCPKKSFYHKEFSILKYGIGLEITYCNNCYQYESKHSSLIIVYEQNKQKILKSDEISLSINNSFKLSSVNICA